MAKAKLGSKKYKGPVHEGWGRPIKDLTEHIDKSLRDALGMNKKPKAKPKPKSTVPKKTRAEKEEFSKRVAHRKRTSIKKYAGRGSTNKAMRDKEKLKGTGGGGASGGSGTNRKM
jgi:hypothetical protein